MLGLDLLLGVLFLVAIVAVPLVLVGLVLRLLFRLALLPFKIVGAFLGLAFGAVGLVVGGALLIGGLVLLPVVAIAVVMLLPVVALGFCVLVVWGFLRLLRGRPPARVSV